MMGDEEKQHAREIVNHPAIVESFQGNYKIIYDSTNAGDVHNLEKAINIMAEKGWQPTGGLATVVKGVANMKDVYVLMRRIEK